MARVVVVGAGVAGLGTALYLARRDHEVVLVDRDAGLAGREPVPVEARHGVPQARHSHAFLARLRNQLRDDAPDVLDALLDAGATELRFLDDPPPTLTDRSPRPGDKDLVALACRRTTFEDVVRPIVVAEPTVQMLDGRAVTGLIADDTTTPTVTGVVVSDGGGQENLHADAVIDASGRRSRLPHLLTGVGATPPSEHTQECGIVYFTRFYALLPGLELPEIDGPIGGDLGYFKYMVFLGDNATFSVTVGLPTEDQELRRLLLHGDAFDAALRMMPAAQRWIDPALAVPTGEVAVMAGLKNQRRRLVVDGRPVALGVHAVGDAAVCTNPLYGRGCSLGLLHARLCADVLEAEGWSTEAASLALDGATERELEPWYQASVEQDRGDIASRRAASEAGGPTTNEGGFQDLLRNGFMPAARTDPEVYRAFLRMLNVLQLPSAVLGAPELLTAVMEAYAARDTRPAEPALGPERRELLAALHS